MQNKVADFPPIALINTYTTNLVAPAAAGAGGVGYTATADVLFIRQIRFVNKTSAGHSVRVYKGATAANAAGTELTPVDYVIPALGYQDMYFQPALRLEGANGFLVGGADAAAAVVMYPFGEIGKV